MSTEKVCSFEGCEKPLHAKGLCAGHKSQKYHGKPLTPLRPRRKSGTRNGKCPCGKPHTASSNMCTGCKRAADRWAFYRLRPADYQALWDKQGGKCALCLTPEDEMPKSLCVDHDHGCCPGHKSCGKCVRGLLCQACNRSLGLLKDSLLVLRNAVAYLEEHEHGDETSNC